MANVKETLKKNDTQADVNLLHAMKKLPGQSVNDYKNALLEAGTRIMLAENYTESQIKDQLKIIFIANVRPEIHELVKPQYPKSWEDAVMLARNVEGDLPSDSPVVAAFRGNKNNDNKGKPGNKPKGQKGGSFDINKIKCHYGKQLGHFKSNCPSLAQKKAAKNTAGAGSGPPDAAGSSSPPP